VKSLRNDMNRRICPSCGALPWTKCQTADGRPARMHVRRWSCPRCGAGREDGPICSYCKMPVDSLLTAPATTGEEPTNG
jgi:ribosomal protein S27AE